jgi:hypothetical protein
VLNFRRREFTISSALGRRQNLMVGGPVRQSDMILVPLMTVGFDATSEFLESPQIVGRLAKGNGNCV